MMFSCVLVVFCLSFLKTEATAGVTGVSPHCPCGVSNCDNGEHNCDKNAVCTDELQPSGSCKVTCACKEGYTGDGTRGNCQAKWRDDLKCGPNFPLASGEPAECNPDNEDGYTCCSFTGSCGKTYYIGHLLWCTDYAKQD